VRRIFATISIFFLQKARERKTVKEFPAAVRMQAEPSADLPSRKRSPLVLSQELRDFQFKESFQQSKECVACRG
jgi:hypothetical protein